MLPIVNRSNDSPQLLQIPDHLKCGEVYTWLCNGDLYAVECVLCEDKPLCPLSEFPQHMDIWHTDWEHNESDSITDDHIEGDILYDDDDDDDDDNDEHDDPLLSFINEDSGLCEQDHVENVEHLEPFEQVLIEQEEYNTLTTIEINEDVVENEHTAIFDDTDYIDINEGIIIEHDDSTLAMQQQVQAKLKGEIVCAHNQLRKQEIVNKTITNRSIANEKKPKQKQKYKQSKHQQFNDALQKQRETSEMEQTREQNMKEIKTTNESNLNIITHSKKHKRDPLTFKNRKRTCKQKLKREHVQQMIAVNTGINGNSKDLKEENFIENLNKTTGSSDLDHGVLGNESTTPSNGGEENTQSRISSNNEEKMMHEKTNTEINSDLEKSLTVCKIGNASDWQENTSEHESFMQNIRNLRETIDSNLSIKRDSNNLSDTQENTHECDSFIQNMKDLRESEDSNLSIERDSNNTKDMQENLNESENSNQNKEKNSSFMPNLSDLKAIGERNLNNKRETKSTTVNFQEKMISKQNSKLNEESISQQERLLQLERAGSDIEESFLENKKEESLSQLVREENEQQEVLMGHVATDISADDSKDSNQLENSNFSTHIGCKENTLVKENFLNQPGDTEKCLSSLKKLDLEEFTSQNENLSQEITDPSGIEENLKASNDTEENSQDFKTFSPNMTVKSKDLEEHRLKRENSTQKVRETSDIQESFKREEERQSKNVEVVRETTDNEANGEINRKRCKIQRISKIKTEKRKRFTRNQNNLTFSQRRQTNKVGKAIKRKEPTFKELLVRTRSANRKLREKLKAIESQNEESLNANDSRNYQKFVDKDCIDFPYPAQNISNPSAALEIKLRRNDLKTNEVREDNLEFSTTNSRDGNRNPFEYTNSSEEIISQPQENQIISQIPKVLTSNPSFSWNLRSKHLKINEELNQEANSSLTNQVWKENSQRVKEVKQTLVSQFFQTKIEKPATDLDKAQFSFVQCTEQIDSDTKTCVSASLPSPHSTSNTLTSQLSPLSPKTEEEHFEFYEPKQKLTKHHVSYLIELYKQHPRLWDQSHADFCEPHLCRNSWEEITQLWNTYCKRNFTIAEVRIRICTLCQRYLQERERLALEGELDEFAKFPYYEQMRFLELQKSLQKRKDLYDQQNEKLLEIYKHFPVLWHVSCYKLRQAKERANAFQSISKALKLCDIHLSAMGVQKRLRSLKKCYRLEKIRYLHAQVEQMPFESNFRHFQKMQFLDKHIDPFVCRICGKIFENLSGFREHLEEENHGSILQEDSDSESDQKENEKEELMHDEKDSSLKECEEQREEPLLEKPIIQEVLIFPPNSLLPKMLKHLPMGDQIIEQMIEDVANTKGFQSPTLDSFISSANNCEEITVNNDFVEEIVSALQPSSINSSFVEDFLTEPLESCSNEGPKPIETDLKTLTETEDSQEARDQPLSSEPMVVKVQCADFSLDLKLDPNQEILNDSDNDFLTSMNNSKRELPLADCEVRKMIGLYRKYPQLWNPNHLDFNSRNLRRQAWFTLTAEFCEAVGKQLSWRTLHRKLTDYAKYYKRLITEQEEDCKENNIKWTFYEDFKFLDDVIAVHDELQRSVHHRDNNFKIIAIYETLPQLWNIKHQDFNKRNIKQRNIELMCNRLQEENNLQITSERLKNRIIELRAQYRAAKKQRLKCEESQQKFVTDFEFYEALKFLDDHIDPFVCKPCKMEFKKLTDYNHHLKRQHESKKVLRNKPLSLLPHEPEQDGLLENVCHICGIKFTTRSNLVHHVKRHEGIRDYACPMCPKKFFASHSLKVHIRSHTKECPYTCEKCGMSFVSASKLNQHAKRHSNKKDYVCNYCPKAFYAAFERDRHERRHLNIRDKACPICGKTFVAGSSYYAHKMLHNDTKRFKCDKCDMEFAQYAGLYKHRKRHHGMEELK